ncbi:class I SAM-dependent methyltransferase [Phyllobacterium zundukense]|uniref:Class I SAM-dependent methyltransferase n=1 Tax=Phyllobacterium zundukense TaxID=1867719 RepID=A0ACD4CZ00_9HYPH|nr:class I SAM-dependent methyltransferase [Phyllobacterium zundukense]UXN58757.1 class I SAM-dependent methyltransferase [Phyllobacterium zundukense]
MPATLRFIWIAPRRFGDPVLEIGTGTGRISVPLAIAGNEVVGLDISPAMLERAAAKLADGPEVGARLQLVEGDMTNFDLNRQFPLIVNTARSFQHLLTPSQQREALQCAHRHLKPGGHLVLDLFDPYFELLFANASTPAAPREVLDVSSGRKNTPNVGIQAQ